MCYAVTLFSTDVSSYRLHSLSIDSRRLSYSIEPLQVNNFINQSRSKREKERERENILKNFLCTVNRFLMKLRQRNMRGFFSFLIY